MNTLLTPRLTLRGWREDDAEFVFDLYSRWEVQRFIGRVPRVMTDPAEARERIRAWRALQDPVHAIWAVEITATGGLAGTLLLKSIPASGDTLPLEESGDTEIGWHFHPRAWGHGYATEAAEAALRHAFQTGLSRVVAVTASENLASQRVCTRIGMRHEGRTAAYYNTTCELFVAEP